MARPHLQPNALLEARSWTAPRGPASRALARQDLAAERGWVLAAMFKEIAIIDDENTRSLRAALPKAGWFPSVKEAPNLPEDAWLIVQHSQDPELQTTALERISEALKTGSVQPRDYALLFDRIRVNGGKPQRFASQVACVAGRWTFKPVEDLAAVDSLRRELGWDESLEQTKQRLSVGRTC